MHIVAVPLLGIIFNILLQCIEANLALDFKVTKISANHKPANCNVANTTYAHGETFKLDCKTQCVCENGRHACSSLCPKEQLPAPEDTISCRSPRLVEVPGHCCKMWLCENPTADVYATCHNSSTSPWTPCSRKCGLGISTRFTTTTAGCNQLSNLRLCENRKCETQQDNIHKQPFTAWTKLLHGNDEMTEKENEEEKQMIVNKEKYLMKRKQLKNKLKRRKQQTVPEQQEYPQPEHRIRKGHECRSIQRLGPARIRLGQCVSKKLYRPKICGRCHQNTKCCVPSVSTTIQVELLCPLNAMDPISFVQQQLTAAEEEFFYQQSDDTSSSSSSSTRAAMPLSLTSLWDTQSLDAIDQEYLQSHQIKIVNKFIAVEWILKCECTTSDNCQQIVNKTVTDNNNSNSNSSNSNSSSSSRQLDYADNEHFVDNNGNIRSINYLKFKHDNNKDNNNNNYNNNIHKKNNKQQTTIAALKHNDKISSDDNINSHYMQLWYGDEKKYDDDYDYDTDTDSDAKTDADNDSNININGNNNIYSQRHVDKVRAKTIINSERNNVGHKHYQHHHHHHHYTTYLHSHNNKKQTKAYEEIYKNPNNNENNKQYERKSQIVDNEQQQQQQQEDKDVKKLWPSASLPDSLLIDREVEETLSSTSSSDEVQPDIIPDPPQPFSANKRTTNSKTNNNNSNNNWLKEKLQLQQQQQYAEQQWLVKQNNNNSNNNNKPYHEHKATNSKAT